MTAQLERPPKKIRIQYKTNAEKSLALAERINNACGGALDDKVALKDLFFWNVKDSPNSHPSDEWTRLIQELPDTEKVPFFHALGYIARKLKKEQDNPSLGDLRSLSKEELLQIRGINIITADLLIGAFRKPLRLTSQVGG